MRNTNLSELLRMPKLVKSRKYVNRSWRDDLWMHVGVAFMSVGYSNSEFFCSGK